MEESNLSSKVSARVETITPELATRYLLYNNINRPLKKKTVEYYAEQMRKGQWLLNGEAICFDRNGGMVNGQHRLNAIIKAGVPIDILVVRGCDPNSFNVYDSGVNRTVADVFALNDIPYHVYISSIIARYIMIRGGWKFLKEPGDKKGSKVKEMKKSRQDMLDEYNSSPELYQDICRLAKSCVEKLNIFTVSEIGGFAIFLIKDKCHNFNTVSKFMRMLFWGEDVLNGTINILREKIVKDKMSTKSVMTANYKQAILFKTWNAYVTRKELRTLSYSKDRDGNIAIL